MHAYDATTIALEVLKKTTDPKAVRRKLLSVSSFSGVQDQLAFDRFGNQKAPSLYLARIVNGKFVTSD